MANQGFPAGGQYRQRPSLPNILTWNRFLEIGANGM
jgi:hypothetical protein